MKQLIHGGRLLTAGRLDGAPADLLIDGDTIAAVLPPRANRLRQLLVDVASFAFCAFFAWKSWTLLEEAWSEDYHSGSTWGPPLWIPYSLMTAGMTFLCLRFALQIVDAVLSKRKTPA